jgi:hydroxyacylglutathione hydrolase
VQQEQRPRELREVAPGVWVATAVIWASNSVVVVDDGAALVVDPGITVSEVDGLAAAAADRGWHVVAGLSTHPHWDHALWTRSLGDVPRFATARAVAAMAADVERGWAEASAAAPGHDRALFGALTSLEDVADTLLLSPPVPRGCHVLAHDAHAPGHLALVTRGVLVAGDMLSDREVPLLDVGPGGDLSRAPADPLGDYRAALDRLERAVAAHGVEVLVPGHGSVAVGRGAITARFDADRWYLDALASAASRGPDVTDPRLADPWVAGVHRAQLGALRARRSAGPIS